MNLSFSNGINEINKYNILKFTYISVYCSLYIVTVVLLSFWFIELCYFCFLWWVSMNVKEEWKVHLLWMRNLNTYQLMTSVTGKWLINCCDQHQPSKSEFLESEVCVYTYPLILFIWKLTPGRLCSIPCYFFYKASDVLPMNNLPFAIK